MTIQVEAQQQHRSEERSLRPQQVNTGGRPQMIQLGVTYFKFMYSVTCTLYIVEQFSSASTYFNTPMLIEAKLHEV